MITIVSVIEVSRVESLWTVFVVSMFGRCVFGTVHNEVEQSVLLRARMPFEYRRFICESRTCVSSYFL